MLMISSFIYTCCAILSTPVIVRHYSLLHKIQCNKINLSTRYSTQQPVIGRSSLEHHILLTTTSKTTFRISTTDNRSRPRRSEPSWFIDNQVHLLHTQQQSPYIAQQPSTYQNPVNKQVDTQNDARQPNIYQIPYQVPYIHRSHY